MASGVSLSTAGLLRTRLRLLPGPGRVEPQDGRLGVVRVGFGASPEVGEGQPAVLLHRGDAEVFAAEEQQRVEEDGGGVRAQLFAPPEELLLNAGRDATCGGERSR